VTQDFQKVAIEEFRVEAAMEALGYAWEDIIECLITPEGIHIKGKDGYEAHIPIAGRRLSKTETTVDIKVPKLPSTQPMWGPGLGDWKITS